VSNNNQPSIKTLENSTAYKELKSCNFLPAHEFDARILSIILDYIRSAESSSYPGADFGKVLRKRIQMDQCKVIHEGSPANSAEQ